MDTKCGQCSQPMQKVGEAVTMSNGRQFQEVTCQCGCRDLVYLGREKQ